MDYIKKLLLIIAILTISTAGVLYSQTEGEKIGVVTNIDKQASVIIVGSPSAAKDLQMGDLLYVRIDGKIVLLRVIFPMQTISKCKAEGRNRALWVKAGKGMTVYRYKKGIEDIGTVVKDEAAEDTRDRTYRGGTTGGVIHYDTGN